MCPRLLAGVAIALLVGISARGAAAEERAAVRWIAPASCASERAINDEVRRILGPPGEGPRKSVEAEARVEEGPGGWSVALMLHVDGATTTRGFSGASCGEIASATALILALTIDAGAQVPPDLPPPPPPATEAPVVAPPSSRAPAAPRRPWHLSALGVVVLDTATLPAASFGPAVGVSFGWAPVRLEVEGAIYLPRSTTGGDFGSKTVGGRGCLEAARGRLTLGPCVASRLVVASAEGKGTASSFERDVVWADLGLDALGRLAVGPLALRASFGARAPLRRPAFVLGEPVPPDVIVHRPASLTFLASIGVEVVFL